MFRLQKRKAFKNYIMPVILYLIFNSSAQGVWLDMEVSMFKSYYTCYYNKYFQVKFDDDNPNRKKFVASLLEDALKKKGEVAPTEPCVSWMCDPSLHWSGAALWRTTSRFGLILLLKAISLNHGVIATMRSRRSSRGTTTLWMQ